MKFELRSGDGNMGTSHDAFIYADDMDKAVEQAAEYYCLEKDKVYGEYTHIASGVSVTEDGDDMVTYLTASFGPQGERSSNDGSWWFSEVIAVE
jgi:uncharacterized protein (DUF2126 family)